MIFPIARQPVLVASLALACALAACAEKKAPAEEDKSADEANHPKDCLAINASDPRLKYLKLEEVQPDAVGASLRVTGKIGFDEDHTQRVASPVDGRVTQLLVKPGDHVKAGDPLLELSSPMVATFEADAKKAQQDLDVAQRNYERAQKLAADHAISEKELAQADADFQKAKTDVGRTTAQLKALGLGDTDPVLRAELRAQVPGTVVERNVLVGQEVRADAAQPLITISSLAQVWALASVYEQDLSAIHVGGEVLVHVIAYPGELFHGRVSYIGDVVDPATRTVTVRVVLANPQNKLKPEMFAKVEFVDHTDHDLLDVPSKAVLNDGSVSKVVVSKNGVFCVRPVMVGNDDDGRVRILGGLDKGETIVTDGALFMKQEVEGG